MGSQITQAYGKPPQWKNKSNRTLVNSTISQAQAELVNALSLKWSETVNVENPRHSVKISEALHLSNMVNLFLA